MQRNVMECAAYMHGMFDCWLGGLVWFGLAWLGLAWLGLAWLAGCLFVCLFVCLLACLFEGFLFRVPFLDLLQRTSRKGTCFFFLQLFPGGGWGEVMPLLQDVRLRSRISAAALPFFFDECGAGSARSDQTNSERANRYLEVVPFAC